MRPAPNCSGSGRGASWPSPTDVSDEAQVRSLIDQAISRHGRVDVLINNAGLIQVGPVETMTLDDFRDGDGHQLLGRVYATLAVLPHMKAQGFGRIGNVVVDRRQGRRRRTSCPTPRASSP